MFSKNSRDITPPRYLQSAHENRRRAHEHEALQMPLQRGCENYALCIRSVDCRSTYANFFSVCAEVFVGSQFAERDWRTMFRVWKSLGNLSTDAKKTAEKMQCNVPHSRRYWVIELRRCLALSESASRRPVTNFELCAAQTLCKHRDLETYRDTADQIRNVSLFRNRRL